MVKRCCLVHSPFVPLCNGRYFSWESLRAVEEAKGRRRPGLTFAWAEWYRFLASLIDIFLVDFPHFFLFLTCHGPCLLSSHRIGFSEVFLASPLCPCTASPILSMSYIKPFPSQILGCSRKVTCRHCGSISGREQHATIAAPRLHYAVRRIVSGCNGRRVRLGAYLAFKEDGGGACEVALVVCLLHRRGRLAAHHVCGLGA